MLGKPSAAAISAVMLFIPAMDRGVYCMFDWPPHKKTSPNSTSLMVAECTPSPSAASNEIVVPLVEAAVAGSACRHTPSVPTVLESAAEPATVVLTYEKRREDSRE